MSLNLYIYCANNPIIFVDPYGNKFVLRNEEMILEQDKNGKTQETLRNEISENLSSNILEEHGMVKVVAAPFSSDDALNTILDLHVEDIEISSQDYNVPREMIEAILYREITCFRYNDFFDVQKAQILGDASIGLGQIFISTARRAEEAIDGITRSDTEIRKRLANPSSNIRYVAMVLKHIASKVKVHGIYKNIDLNNATKVETIMIFRNYNGSGDTYDYGINTYEYYEQFSLYHGDN